MNRKSVAIFLAYIVLGSVLGLSGHLYFDLDGKHTKLQSDYNSMVDEYNLLQSDYHGLETDYQNLNNTHHVLVNDYTQLNQTYQTLILEYNELNASYRILAHNHSELEHNYNELSDNYTDLSNEYVVLQGQFESLFNDYNALQEAFNEPLSSEEMPSTYELEQWLAVDETDDIQYVDPDFVCGDFAVMLSLHAKLKHWDMGVVGVIGGTESSGSFAHAFNAIICEEGLVYVEPQTDEVWWYEDHEEITEGELLRFPGFGEIHVEEYIVIVWYS